MTADENQKLSNEDNPSAVPSAESQATVTLDAALSARELDAAVAERVMGWTLTRRGGEGKYRDSMYWKGAPQGSGGQVDWHWSPSEDLREAMLVLEKMISLKWRVRILGDDAPVAWDAVFWRDDYSYGQTGHVLAEAICRAALAAIEAQDTNTAKPEQPSPKR